ncbi:hypothetical protein D3C76_1558280 [compost metagenome]
MRGIEDRHRAVGIAGFDKGIPQITQHRADKCPHCRVVFNDQNGFAMLCEQWMVTVHRQILRQVATVARQIKAHRGAFAHDALNGDMAP